MGVPKVLLPAGEGHTLLSRVLATALASVDGQAVVILGRDADLCRAEVKRFLRDYSGDKTRVLTLENSHYRDGLSTSLRLGVQEVLKQPADMMVFLADQPAFDKTRARDLIRAFHQRRPETVAVVAAEGGQRRNPVIFSAALLPELLNVAGDKGARGVLKRYGGRVERLELGSGPWFVDTDEWATYAKLMRERGWLEEVSIPKLVGELSRELTKHVEAQVQRDPQPLLAPDVLLVGVESKEVMRTVRLERPNISSLTKLGIQSVIIGDSTSPEAYLNLLRRAALWTLRRSAV